MSSEKNLVKNLKCQEIGQILCTVLLLLPEEIRQKKKCSKLPVKTSVQANKMPILANLFKTKGFMYARII